MTHHIFFKFVVFCACTIYAQTTYKLHERLLYFNSDSLLGMEAEHEPHQGDIYEVSWNYGMQHLKSHDGKYWHVFYDESEGDRNAYLRSSSDGQSWTNKVRINDDSLAAAQQQVTAEINGSGSNLTVVVGWQDLRGDIPQTRVAVSTDAGLSFGQSVQLSDFDSSHFRTYADLAIADNGTIYALWDGGIEETGHVDGTYFRKSSDGGISWTQTDQIYQGEFSEYGCQIVAGSDGKVLAIFKEGEFKSRGNIRTLTSSDYGDTWENAAPVVENEDFQSSDLTSLTVGPNGVAHVIFTDYNQTSGQGYYMSCFSADWGQSWSDKSTVSNEDEQLGLYGSWSGWPNITVSASGIVYAVWADTRYNPATANQDIYISRSQDGGLTWSEDLRINEDPDPVLQRYPSVAIKSDGSNDTVLVVWSEGMEFINPVEPGAHSIDGFTLNQNYPNPFNPSTTVSYQLPVATGMTLKIYDTSGRMIRMLADGFEAAGNHQIEWDGRDDLGRVVASGVYFYRLALHGSSAFGITVQTKKMLLVR